jgi:hypothetical protein
MLHIKIGRATIPGIHYLLIFQGPDLQGFQTSRLGFVRRINGPVGCIVVEPNDIDIAAGQGRRAAVFAKHQCAQADGCCFEKQD